MKNWPIMLFLAVWLVITAVWVAERFELRAETYEDGSGRLTWCLPWAPCQD